MDNKKRDNRTKKNQFYSVILLLKNKDNFMKFTILQRKRGMS